MPFDAKSVLSYVNARDWYGLTDPLPDKPSALIRVALDDLEKAEKHPLYSIDMGIYHSAASYRLGEPYGGCKVCLAGAVMAGHLRAAPSREALPSNYPLSIRRKLEALDCFRRGDVVDALSYLDEDTKTLAKVGAYWRIVPYERDIGLFKEQMRALADRLEEAGA